MELNAEQIKKALECCKTPLASDCENCSYTGKRLEDGVYEGCVNCLVGDALSLITSQEQRIGAQDMTISELRQRTEKAEHDADRYAQRIKELTEKVKNLKQAMEHEHASFMETFGEYGEKCERLTEENERLRGCVKSKEEVEAIMRATYEPLVKEIAKEQIDKAVTDTVRKMQERLKPYEYRLSCRFCKHSLKGRRNEKCDNELNCGGWNKWESVIDQIAKEMLEGKEET